MSAETDSETRANAYKSLALLEEELAEGEIAKEDYEKLKAKYLNIVDDNQIETQSEGGRPPRVVDPQVVNKRKRKKSTTISVIVILLIAATAVVGIALGTRDRTSNDPATGEIAETESDQVLRAQDLVSQGKTVEALKIYDQVIKANPKSADALSNKGWLIFQAGISGDRPDLVARGTKLVALALKYEPDFAPARFFRAEMYRNAGDKPKAIAEYNKFLASDPPESIANTVKARRDALK